MSAPPPLSPPDPAGPRQDVIDACVPLRPGQATHAVRQARPAVVAATQASHDGLFATHVDGLSLPERLAVAWTASRLSQAGALAAHYQGVLQATEGGAALVRALQSGPAAADVPPRLRSLIGFATKLVERPIEGDRAAVQSLVQAGLDAPAIVGLAQLVAFVSYQVRLVAGLQALVAAEGLPAEPAEPSWPADAAPATPDKDADGPLRLNGFTDETLDWLPWLPTVQADAATPEQLAALDAMNATARQSPYFLLLAHQPAILLHRSVAFNAIMFAPGGLSRAERELGATVESRLNGCVYCTAVHAQRFAQLARRRDVTAQLFQRPEGAGTSPRERALVQFSARLGLQPHALAATDVQRLAAVGMAPLEVLDLVHAVALFAWANRLMLNLGEAVRPAGAA